MDEQVNVHLWEVVSQPVPRELKWFVEGERKHVRVLNSALHDMGPHLGIGVVGEQEVVDKVEHGLVIQRLSTLHNLPYFSVECFVQGL
jgi:hypothetical protein